jgi:hypothetical protein
MGRLAILQFSIVRYIETKKYAYQYACSKYIPSNRIGDACVSKLRCRGRDRGSLSIAPLSRAVSLRPEYTPERRQNISTTTVRLLFPQVALHSYDVFTMALASKTQSQNIFAKLKAKPANKVSSLNREGGQSMLTIHVDMFRLRRKEPNMEFRTFRHLPMP